jgi:hypothetical protein
VLACRDTCTSDDDGAVLLLPEVAVTPVRLRFAANVLMLRAALVMVMVPVPAAAALILEVAVAEAVVAPEPDDGVMVAVFL